MFGILMRSLQNIAVSGNSNNYYANIKPIFAVRTLFLNRSSRISRDQNLTSILRNLPKSASVFIFKRRMPASEQSRSNFCKQFFDPCRDLFLNPLSGHSYGVLILNSPTKLVNDDLWKIWNFADLRVLVDGGSESWTTCKKIKDLSLPHLVTGDFDSISHETLLSFKQNEEVKVINTPDQNATDFTKALIELDCHRANNGMDLQNVYVVTEMIEGRIDHVMANINTLFEAAKQFPHLRVFRLSSDSISWLLTPGSYSIVIPEVLRDNREWCSLVPVGAPAVITTSGLKWNLNNHKCLFGGMVSTSNTYDGSPVVEIQTDSPILWSMSTTGLNCKV